MILFLRDSLLPYAVFKVRSRDSSRFVPLPLSGVGSLVGSSGLEPPLPAVRNGRAASLPLASLPCSLAFRLASSATGGARLRPRAYQARGWDSSRFVSLLPLVGWVTGGLKWTRTTDLALIRRAL